MFSTSRHPLSIAVYFCSIIVAAGAILFTGCGGGAPGEDRGEVVLYTSLNEPTARAVIDAFEEETGIRVIVQADTERDKTVGLVRTLIEERNLPRADLFWNSETANTIHLKEEGILEPLSLPADLAGSIPGEYKDPEGYWYGFAARARVFIVNTELVAAEDHPTSIMDIVDPRWKGQAAIVRPVTGTTLTHVAALYEVWGEERTNEFLAAIIENECPLPPGNGRVARLVGEGRIPFGLTDTSDLRLVAEEGFPVTAVYPDQDGLGTLLIPNTVARVAGGPNPENARRLAEFLLSEEAESILAHHPRGHIPLKPGVDRPDFVRVPGEFRTMEVDFEAVGRQVADRMEQLDALFP